MSRSRRLSLLSLFALLAGACGTPPEAPPPIERAGTVSGRALLVGISEYQSEDVTDLNGPSSDVETMQTLLTSRFGFLPENVEVLRDAEATRKGILEALQRLVASVRPDEVVVFYFSGHGSQVPDRGGDEEDDLDESLVPHDGRTGKVPDVTDDELFRNFRALDPGSILVILDCCNSGSGTRGLAVRSLEPDARGDLYAAEESPESLSRDVELVEAPHVLLSAARADQVAVEETIDGRTQGVFTYAISKALAELPADMSIREMMKGYLEPELERLKVELDLDKLADPQLEAPRALMDRPLFRVSEGGPRLPWVEVSSAAGGELLLRGAAARAARPGSVWAVYPPRRERLLARTCDRPGRGHRGAWFGRGHEALLRRDRHDPGEEPGGSLAGSSSHPPHLEGRGRGFARRAGEALRCSRAGRAALADRRRGGLRTPSHTGRGGTARAPLRPRAGRARARVRVRP